MCQTVFYAEQCTTKDETDKGKTEKVETDKSEIDKVETEKGIDRQIYWDTRLQRAVLIESGENIPATFQALGGDGFVNCYWKLQDGDCFDVVWKSEVTNLEYEKIMNARRGMATPSPMKKPSAATSSATKKAKKTAKAASPKASPMKASKPKKSKTKSSQVKLIHSRAYHKAYKAAEDLGFDEAEQNKTSSGGSCNRGCGV